jgi:hypothetical protein
MPIKKDEFEKGRREDSLENRIENFLKESQDSAFSQSELAEVIFGKTRPPKDFIDFLVNQYPNLLQLNEAIKTLIQENKIEAKTIGGTTYYIRKK